MPDKICNGCGELCEDLHKHHIIPRSRGGKDDEKNLVFLCIDCHGKAHDVSFTSNRGVVASGINKAKEAGKLATAWADGGGIDRLMDNLLKEDKDLYTFLSYGMLLGMISKDFLFQIVEPEFASRMSGSINLKKCNMAKIRGCYDGIRH